MTDENGDVWTDGYWPNTDRLKVAAKHAGSPTGLITKSYTYTYDNAGNITQRDEKTGGTTVTTTYTYNEDNVLLTDSYTTDGAGQLTGGPGGLSLSYNALQQTTSVTPASGSATALGYAGGNQVEQTTDGTTTLQNSILGISRAIAASTTYYTRDNRGVLVAQRRSGNKWFYTYDGRGNVRAVTSSVNGNNSQSYTYDPYGQTTASGSSANAFRYQGGYTSATGLTHFGYRWYSSGVGRRRTR